MSLRIERVDSPEAAVSLDSSAMEVVLGRGPLLRIADVTMSRNVVTLRRDEADISAWTAHAASNVSVEGVDGVRQLRKGAFVRLNNGDVLKLAKDKYHYKLVIEAKAKVAEADEIISEAEAHVEVGEEKETLEAQSEESKEDAEESKEEPEESKEEPEESKGEPKEKPTIAKVTERVLPDWMMSSCPKKEADKPVAKGKATKTKTMGKDVSAAEDDEDTAVKATKPKGRAARGKAAVKNDSDSENSVEKKGPGKARAARRKAVTESDSDLETTADKKSPAKARGARGKAALKSDSDLECSDEKKSPTKATIIDSELNDKESSAKVEEDPERLEEDVASSPAKRSTKKGSSAENSPVKRKAAAKKGSPSKDSVPAKASHHDLSDEDEDGDEDKENDDESLKENKSPRKSTETAASSDTTAGKQDIFNVVVI
jgi:hypothetical protein